MAPPINHQSNDPPHTSLSRTSRLKAAAPGLPAWIAIGAVAGILAGIGFGERMAVFRPIGSAYAMLLQIAVYPYLLSSLLYALGRLVPDMALRLLRSSWGVYLFLWAVTFGTIWLLGRAIPAPLPPSTLIPSPAMSPAALLNLLIPSNLVVAAEQNYVPAVVVFAIIYGIAIQKVQRKASLLEVLQVIQSASVTIWGWIVRVAPIGVFALFATSAGTLQPDRLAGLLLYVALFMIGTVLLALVVLPAVLSAVAPVGYRTILKELQPALVLALVTTLSVAALPFIQKAAERITAEAGCPDDEERNNIIQASLSLSYVLAQLGNYFIYLLFLYSAFDFQVQFTAGQRSLLPVLTLLSGLGSPTSTINGVVFLSHWLRLPSDVLQVYLETGTVTRYGQVLLSVTGFGFATIVIPLVYFKRLRLHLRWGVTAAAASVVLLGAVVAGGVALRSKLLPSRTNAELVFTLDPRLVKGVDVTIRKAAPDRTQPPPVHGDALSDFVSSGVLRIGYNPDVIPFSYRNNKGDLVGYDISFAYQLAHDLHVKLDLIPFDWQSLQADLIGHRFDLAMSGIYMTAERLKALTVTRSYFQSPVALLVPAARATQFLRRDAILARPNLRLAVLDDPVLRPMVNRLFPGAAISVVKSYDELPGMIDRVDGAIWSLQQAGAWATAHPGFTAVAPEGMGSPLLFCYLLPPGLDGFREYLDQWLELKANDAFSDAQAAYWLKGQPRQAPLPRWNLFDALFATPAK